MRAPKRAQICGSCPSWGASLGRERLASRRPAQRENNASRRTAFRAADRPYPQAHDVRQMPLKTSEQDIRCNRGGYLSYMLCLVTAAPRASILRVTRADRRAAPEAQRAMSPAGEHWRHRCFGLTTGQIAPAPRAAFSTSAELSSLAPTASAFSWRRRYLATPAARHAPHAHPRPDACRDAPDVIPAT